MRILVVGSGGREHALVWKIAQSPLVKEVLCTPGNAGIAQLAKCELAKADDIDAVCKLAVTRKVDLVVVGPEGPLCDGLVDRLMEAGIKVFGPNRKAARIEGDKAFAREMCRRHRVPGPGFWVFENLPGALGFLENRPDGPMVIKAAGLAAGKGVTVAANTAQARAAVKECMESRRFGEAGARVVIEDCLSGPEVSVMCLTDGTTFIPLEPARDHKPVGEGDTGPNTGGMGAFSPVPDLKDRIRSQIEAQILLPSVHGLNAEGLDFRGFLYAGLMLTDSGPRVLEYNCRLGDPETQPLMMRLKSDLVPLMLHTIDGTLDQAQPPQWDPRSAVCVMATSEGYPGDYPTGLPVHGLDGLETGEDLQVFHSGTARRGNDIVTSGGRVFSVCALGDGVDEARERAYSALEQLEFAGMHYRRDIAKSGD